MTGKERKNVLVTRFLHEEDGAVTADWVVLAAAVVLLSVPLLVTIKSSTETAASEISDEIVAATD